MLQLPLHSRVAFEFLCQPPNWGPLLQVASGPTTPTRPCILCASYACMCVQVEQGISVFKASGNAPEVGAYLAYLMGVLEDAARVLPLPSKEDGKVRRPWAHPRAFA